MCEQLEVSCPRRCQLTQTGSASSRAQSMQPRSVLIRSGEPRSQPRSVQFSADQPRSPRPAQINSDSHCKFHVIAFTSIMRESYPKGPSFLEVPRCCVGRIVPASVFTDDAIAGLRLSNTRHPLVYPMYVGVFVKRWQRLQRA